MSVKSKILVSLSVVSALFLGTNNAQANQFAGFWQCAMTYTEFHQSGARQSGFTEQFNLQLNPDATFQVRGLQNGVGGAWQYQGQGNWRFGQTQQGLAVGGQGVRSDPTIGQAPFAFALYAGPDSNYLANRNEVPFPNGQGIQSRTLTQCQRGQG